MSASASWSYTAKATHWPLLGRDDWSGQNTYGPPVVFYCDYKAEAVRSADAGGTSPQTGVELALRQVLYTEYAAVKQGDYVLITAVRAPGAGKGREGRHPGADLGGV